MAREHPASGSLNAGRMMYVGRVMNDQRKPRGEAPGSWRSLEKTARLPHRGEETGEVTASRQWPTYAKGRTTRCSRGTGAVQIRWGVAGEGQAAGDRVCLARLGDYPTGYVNREQLTRATGGRG